MKPEMRRSLAQLPFEKKIRKVSQLISLSRNVKDKCTRKPAHRGHGIASHERSNIAHPILQLPSGNAVKKS
jgi:hypothetical protein